MEKIQTTIRLPADLKGRLQREADKKDISFNGLVNLLLSRGVENINPQNLL